MPSEHELRVVEKFQAISARLDKDNDDKNIETSHSGGDNGGMDDLTNHRLETLEKGAERAEAKLDKLSDSIHALDKTLTGVSSRLDLIEKKLPNWWQPYVGVGVLGGLLALMMHFMK